MYIGKRVYLQCKKSCFVLLSFAHLLSFLCLCCNSIVSQSDLSNSSFIVRQTQEEDAGLVNLHGHCAPSPLHLTHGGGLLGSCLCDQRLSIERKKRRTNSTLPAPKQMQLCHMNCHIFPENRFTRSRNLPHAPFICPVDHFIHKGKNLLYST